MSAAVHAEDHQDDELAPAEVTTVQMSPEARAKYEAYLTAQIRMHRTMAENMEILLTSSKSTHD